tara:strand:- start:100468 stop:102231 length:1764 start_codon:yes stop_codon:yes gene_type:complete
MTRNFLLITALFFLAGSVLAQVKFEAKVSKEKLGVNERLRVDFEMNQDGDNFQPPNFNGFRIVAGPNQSVSNMWINGKRTYSKTYSYFLSPTARGSFTLGQASIEIDGETYKTIPIDVEVTAAVDEPKDGENNDIASEGDIHLVAEVSKANPYLNEAITVVYKLYVSPETSVSGWRVIDSPKFADFWSQNTDNNQMQVYEGTYKGKPYRYAILRSTVLYPQKTGELELEPLSLDVQVEVRTNKRDIFGRPFMTRVNKTVSAGTRTIDVKSLPEEGKPADFSGAVGKFDFKVKTNKTKLDATESLEATVEVSGNGNLKLFKPPTLVAPNSFETYEPEFKDRVSTTQNGMRGSISDSYTIIPQFQGSYSIAPISFSYFDPESNSYKTITSDEIVIDVERGPVADSNSIGTNTGFKQPVVLSQEQFKYIKLRPQLTELNKEHFFKSPLFWSLLGSPVLLIPLFIVAGRRKKALENDVEGQRLRKANRLAKKYLSEAKKNTGDQKLFYESLERALHNYLKAKLSIETSDFSKERIEELLQERGVTGETSEAFISILKSCEYARYTPTSEGEIQTDYNNAAEVISSIDKQIS